MGTAGAGGSGGGHCGYGGSDVYGFDLSERKWVRISNPYSHINETSESGTFADGSPIPTHTYDLVDYQPTANRFVLLVAMTSVAGVTYAGTAHLLTLDHLTASACSPSLWKRSPLRRNGSANEGGMSAYDRKRDGFWIWEVRCTGCQDPGGGFNNRLAFYDPSVQNSDGSVGKYSYYPGDRDGFNGGGGADYDPKRDLFVFTFFYSHDSSEVYVRDLTNPETAPSRKIANVSGGPRVDVQNGWEYSDVRDAFLYWNGGADVWALKIQDSATRSFDTAVWTKVSRGSVAPELNVNGNWSRFRIAKFELGGSLVEVALNAGNVGENANDGFVYAFRVPAP